MLNSEAAHSFHSLCMFSSKLIKLKIMRVSQVALVVKNMPANAGDIRDVGSVPGLGRSPGGGHGNPLQPGGEGIGNWVAESDTTEGT